MSRSISDPIPEGEPQTEPASTDDLVEMSMGIFFSLEEMHNKMDAIINHFDIKAIKNPDNKV